MFIPALVAPIFTEEQTNSVSASARGMALSLIHILAELTCVGSLILIGLALNLIGVAKIKVMDFTPAIFMPIAVVPMFDWIGGLF